MPVKSKLEGGLRRQKLIWFALGAACTALAAVLARWIIVPPDERFTYIVVYERPLADDEMDSNEDIVTTSGQLLHECGAKEFWIKPTQTPDGSTFSLIRNTPINEEAIYCLFERAQKEGYHLQLNSLTEEEALLP